MSPDDDRFGGVLALPSRVDRVRQGHHTDRVVAEVGGLLPVLGHTLDVVALMPLPVAEVWECARCERHLAQSKELWSQPGSPFCQCMSPRPTFKGVEVPLAAYAQTCADLGVGYHIPPRTDQRR